MKPAVETIEMKELTLPPELEVVNMTKQFGQLVALDNVSLTLKPGTFHALLGENGAGKSTLVKCVMGFYKPTSGEVRFNQQVQAIDSPRDAQNTGSGWSISTSPLFRR